MAHLKRNGPRAAATARKAKTVASEKQTLSSTPARAIDANSFAKAWVARRCRVHSRWAAIIADAAGLGGRS